jgi:hypothetical protein
MDCLMKKAHVKPKSVRTLIIEYTNCADGLKFVCELSLCSKLVYTNPLFYCIVVFLLLIQYVSCADSVKSDLRTQS